MKFTKFAQVGFIFLLSCGKPTVERAIDGDTLVLEDGTHVRLIGVDAPELGEPGSFKAKEYLSELEGKTIELKYDDRKKDKYGRTLAYVYHNGFINERLVEKGLAEVAIYHNKSKEDELRH